VEPQDNTASAFWESDVIVVDAVSWDEGQVQDTLDVIVVEDAAASLDDTASWDGGQGEDTWDVIVVDAAVWLDGGLPVLVLSGFRI